MSRLLLTVILFFAVSTTYATTPTDTLRIAHVCDPQLGFGKDGFEDDLRAFEREIAVINRLQPDIVLLAGDMVNKMDSTSISEFLRAASEFKIPVIYTPGNHDLPEPVTVAGLELYRKSFGSDFSTSDCKGWRIISINSMLLRGGPEAEVEAHGEKFAAALRDATDDGMPVIILSHVPPFANDIEEADEYFNLPKAMRRALIKDVLAAGCNIWLAGHTHRLGHNEINGLHILNAENTSSNFDGRPRGFRLLTVAPDGDFSWEFIGID